MQGQPRSRLLCRPIRFARAAGAHQNGIELQFSPSRVLLADRTGPQRLIDEWRYCS